jgi:hypothetical protein
MPRDDEAVLLAVASSEIEAQIWRDALEQEGIRPFIRNRAALPYLGSDAFFATYEVFVLAGDLKRAQWIIGEGVEPNVEPPTTIEQEQEATTRD